MAVCGVKHRGGVPITMHCLAGFISDPEHYEWRCSKDDEDTHPFFLGQPTQSGTDNYGCLMVNGTPKSEIKVSDVDPFGDLTDKALNCA